ncbi:hypothetical protein ONE63_002825 [Megalurothrips usitatus]|uniref:Uncharacterized protein n=1 Tax=Megalurothrips usitatus TaxID=439358 RepID=A0AAV7X5F6_9NEOP|nr:hypothetical protein ONE63_002825 [Megalurothrips usitatus]
MARNRRRRNRNGANSLTGPDFQKARQDSHPYEAISSRPLNLVKTSVNNPPPSGEPLMALDMTLSQLTSKPSRGGPAHQYMTHHQTAGGGLNQANWVSTSFPPPSSLSGMPCNVIDRRMTEHISELSRGAPAHQHMAHHHPAGGSLSQANCASTNSHPPSSLSGMACNVVHMRMTEYISKPSWRGPSHQQMAHHNSDGAGLNQANCASTSSHPPSSLSGMTRNVVDMRMTEHISEPSRGGPAHQHMAHHYSSGGGLNQGNWASNSFHPPSSLSGTCNVVDMRMTEQISEPSRGGPAYQQMAHHHSAGVGLNQANWVSNSFHPPSPLSGTCNVVDMRITEHISEPSRGGPANQQMAQHHSAGGGLNQANWASTSSHPPSSLSGIEPSRGGPANQQMAQHHSAGGGLNQANWASTSSHPPSSLSGMTRNVVDMRMTEHVSEPARGGPPHQQMTHHLSAGGGLNQANWASTSSPASLPKSGNPYVIEMKMSEHRSETSDDCVPHSATIEDIADVFGASLNSLSSDREKAAASPNSSEASDSEAHSGLGSDGSEEEDDPVTMVEGSSGNCGAVYLPECSKETDVRDAVLKSDKNEQSKKSKEKEKKKSALTARTLRDLRKKAVEYFEKKDEEAEEEEDEGREEKKNEEKKNLREKKDPKGKGKKSEREKNMKEDKTNEREIEKRNEREREKKGTRKSARKCVKNVGKPAPSRCVVKDGAGLEEVQDAISRTLINAYLQCSSEAYLDEEAQELEERGLLPNGYTPMPPLILEEGEKLLDMWGD